MLLKTRKLSISYFFQVFNSPCSKNPKFIKFSLNLAKNPKIIILTFFRFFDSPCLIQALPRRPSLFLKNPKNNQCSKNPKSLLFSLNALKNPKIIASLFFFAFSESLSSRPLSPISKTRKKYLHMPSGKIFAFLMPVPQKPEIYKFSLNAFKKPKNNLLQFFSLF